MRVPSPRSRKPGAAPLLPDRRACPPALAARLSGCWHFPSQRAQGQPKLGPQDTRALPVSPSLLLQPFPHPPPVPSAERPQGTSETLARAASRRGATDSCFPSVPSPACPPPSEGCQDGPWRRMSLAPGPQHVPPLLGIRFLRHLPLAPSVISVVPCSLPPDPSWTAQTRWGPRVCFTHAMDPQNSGPGSPFPAGFVPQPRPASS